MFRPFQSSGPNIGYQRVECLVAALWLYFAHYNFVRIHGSLRMTPAMAANVTDHLWSVEEMLAAGAPS
jgi:hypothetical protein